MTTPWTPLPADEWNAFEAGVAAYDAMTPREDNPHDRVTAPVLHARWDEGWTARTEELCVRSPVDR